MKIGHIFLVEFTAIYFKMENCVSVSVPHTQIFSKNFSAQKES